MDWIREIVELHEFFGAYFRGEVSSTARAEAVLGADFTIIGPAGSEHDRAGILARIEHSRGHSPDLQISTRDHRLIHRSDPTLVARYVETHDLGHTINSRVSTVVFELDAAAPNGVIWLTVHETWQEP